MQSLSIDEATAVADVINGDLLEWTGPVKSRSLGAPEILNCIRYWPESKAGMSMTLHYMGLVSSRFSCFFSDLQYYLLVYSTRPTTSLHIQRYEKTRKL